MPDLNVRSHARADDFEFGPRGPRTAGLLRQKDQPPELGPVESVRASGYPLDILHVGQSLGDEPDEGPETASSGAIVGR